MNKKLIRLTENDLHRIVKESVNKILCEAYGTPDTNTRVALNNLDAAQHYGDTLYGLKQDNGAEVPYKEVLSFNNGILKLEDDLTTIMRCDPTNPYAWKLSNYVQGMKDLSRRMINRLKMNQGEQPDENYNDSHLSRSKRMAKVQDLNGREDRGDYSGLAGWGG